MHQNIIEISLMTGNKTIADVVCGSPCRVLIIPQDVFTELITTNPPAVNYLSKTVEEKLKAISYDIEQSEFAKASAKKHDDPYGLKLHNYLFIMKLVD
jgi:acetate kinase